MKKFAIGIGVLIILAIILGSIDWERNADTNNDWPLSEIMSMDSSCSDSIQYEDDSIGNGKGLNDIRFANYTEKDWLDNEYIHCLRRYLDDYNNGKIKDEELDPYKEKIEGKFVVGSCQPYLFGGLLLRIMFVDNPDDIFSAWVYSSVDEEAETIMDYSVRGIWHEEEKSGFTKEEILTLHKEHPEQKLW